MFKLIFVLSLLSTSAFSENAGISKINSEFQRTIQEMEQTNKQDDRKDRLNQFLNALDAEAKLADGAEEVSEDLIRVYQLQTGMLSQINAGGCQAGISAFVSLCGEKTPTTQEKEDMISYKKIIQLLCLTESNKNMIDNLCKPTH